jgi:ABC-type phosphate transport system ATPase subunit
MKRIATLLILLGLILSGCSAAHPEQKQYTATFLTLFDTVTTVVGRAESEEAFHEKAQAVHDALLEYHQLFDIYAEYEGISNLKTVNDRAGTAPVQVDRRIIDLLLDCRDFYEATGGTVLVDGVNVKEYPNSQLRAKIGMVPQKAVLFSGTIRSNLLWGKSDATEDEMYDALTAAQALDFVNETARKLDHPVEQNGRNLSGGQRQRLTIARALIRKPEILILDDSSSALDYATDARLRKAIRAMSGDTTLFIVSQRTASLMHADRILVLEDGELAGQGTHTELLENCPVYREIYESQFGDEKEAASHA